MPVNVNYSTDLYADQQGGAIYCFDHLGGYGQADVRADPDAAMWITPLDVWVRLTDDEENAEWVKDFGEDMKCGSCGWTYTQAKEKRDARA